MGKRRIPGGGLTVAAVVAAVLAACSGYGGAKDEHGGGEERKPARSPLSVGALRKLAAEPGTSCPVPYDVPAALRAAGVEADRVESGSVDGELPDDLDTPLARADGALVGCGYRVGAERARLFTVGVARGYAVDVMLPQIQHDARMGRDVLRRYAEEVHEAEPGDAPLVVPGGNVAAVRLPVAGGGDMALVVTVGDDGRTRLSRHRVGALTRNLAHQARLTHQAHQTHS
ncbi:hypothetical protein [Streptomyces tubbatahanensis]|uniref:hypothetical protein n=1 Tax=Streptomyces tubbatahanensis TaxID=2923272 RepID=UPI00237CAFB6|nr:hypothetical protein [Streptomyces tubbatahanensis]